MRFKKFIPGIAWFFLLLILICLPGEKLPAGDDWMSWIFFDKWVHAGLFGILAFLFMYPVFGSPLNKQARFRVLIKIALAVCIWGLTTEFIQKFFVPGRNFDLGDWAADSAGALAALVLSWKKYI